MNPTAAPNGDENEAAAPGAPKNLKKPTLDHKGELVDENGIIIPLLKPTELKINQKFGTTNTKTLADGTQLTVAVDQKPDKETIK